MLGDWVVNVGRPETPPHLGSVVHLVKTGPKPGALVLVVGGCGGGGATTTALGLASQIAESGDTVHPVAVDGSPVGGDLALRGADLRLAAATMQSWLGTANSPAATRLADTLSWSSSGAGVLWRDASPLPQRTTLATVCDRLQAEGLTPIVDGGSAIGARHLRPLLERPDVRLVVAIPCRPDAANRVRLTLQQLDAEFGDALIADTTLLVSHQTPHSLPVAKPLSRHYAGWVRTVLEVPYDRRLAIGTAITHADLSPMTRAAYHTLAEHVLPGAVGTPGEVLDG